MQRSRQNPIRIGVTYKGYTTQRFLGEGGYGWVYLVKKDNRYFAAKFVKVDNRNQHRALKEVDIHLQLDNDYLVKAYQIQLLDELRILMIVMDYCDAGSLADILPVLIGFPEPTRSGNITGIMLQIAKGLKYLHQKKIKHCDIKPQNIMVKSNGAVYLGDFGVAQVVREQHGAIGTFHYMAPELFQLEENYDTSIDIFSLGIVFIELLLQQLISRELPSGVFVGTSPDFPTQELLSRIPNRTYRDLIRRMVSKNPSQRPKIAEVVEILRVGREQQELQVRHALQNQLRQRRQEELGNNRHPLDHRPQYYELHNREQDNRGHYRGNNRRCQTCNRHVNVVLQKKCGCIAYLWVVCLMFSLPPLMWLPLCIDKCLDVEQLCSECSHSVNQRPATCCGWMN